MDMTDYQNLIPPPNKIQPNFMSWFEGHAQTQLDSQQSIIDFVEAFDIDTAVGDQLDVLGDLLGVKRLVNFQPGGGASGLLSDDFYRIALKAKIIFNVWRGTKTEIYEFWQTYFPEYPIMIADNQDMSMSVLVIGMPNDLTGTYSFGFDMEDEPDPDGSGSTVAGFDTGWWTPFNGILRDLVIYGYFVPKPAGVSIEFEFYDGLVFGFDTDGEFIKGFDEGEFIAFS